MVDSPVVELGVVHSEWVATPLGRLRQEAQKIYTQGEERFISSGVGRSVDIYGVDVTPLYHTWDAHIIPTTQALEAVLAEYQEGRGSDPFGITKETTRWKSQFLREHPDIDPRLVDDFFSGGGYLLGLEVAALLHDAGNMPEADGAFQRVGAEAKGADITDNLLDTCLTDYPGLPVLKPFVRHLVMQTVDSGDDPDAATVKSQPFWRLMQAVDQVGSYYYTPVAHETLYAGLMNEFAARGEVMPVSLSDVLTFVNRRTDKLLYLPEELREPVLAMWSANSKLVSPNTFSRPVSVDVSSRPVDYDLDISHLTRIGHFYDSLSRLGDEERNGVLRHDLGSLVANIAAWGENIGDMRGYELDIKEINELFTPEAIASGLYRQLPKRLIKTLFNWAQLEAPIQGDFTRDAFIHAVERLEQLPEFKRFADLPEITIPLIDSLDFLQTQDPKLLEQLKLQKIDLGHAARFLNVDFSSELPEGESTNIDGILFPPIYALSTNAEKFQKKWVTSVGLDPSTQRAQLTYHVDGSIVITNNSIEQLPENLLQLGVKGEQGNSGIGTFLADFYATLAGYELTYEQTPVEGTNGTSPYYAVKFTLRPKEEISKAA